MTEKLHTLIHQPRGNEHPYKRKPFERVPRDPAAGEAVTLGAVTQPPGAAEQVWAEWTADGENWHEVTAVEVGQDEKETAWQAVLPAFAAGLQVTYRLCAAQGDTLLCSPIYSMSIPGWEQTTRVAGVQEHGGAVILQCVGPNSDVRAALTLTQPEIGRLHLHWTSGADGNLQEETASYSSLQIVEENGERIRVKGEGIEVRVDRDPYRLTICGADGTVLLDQEAGPGWLVGPDGHCLLMRLRFNSPENEAFYGFGERFNQLDQRRQILDVRVYEAYKSQGKHTYIPMPLHISSQGYGLLVDTNRYVVYDLAATDSRLWTLTAELNDGALAYDIITAAHPWQIAGHLTQLTARPVMPPAWAFGPWMSANDWNNQALVMEQMRQTVKHGIPATVMVIEAWSDESTFYIWNDARYEPQANSDPFRQADFTFPAEGLWPDPQHMIEDLHEAGLYLVLWQIPALKTPEWAHEQCAIDRAHMVENGYCVQEADGSPYRIRPFWFHDDLLLDVTSQEALDWWLGKRAYLLDEMGIDGFKTDGGEHMWGRDLQFADGRSGAELWNLYPNLYVGAYYNFANEKKPGQTLTFSRAGYTGVQAYPCHWAGDENSTWEAFRASIMAGLSAGISGIPFWGWDLGGFSGEIPSAELYLRSAAMATFCPIMQYHAEYNGRKKPCRDRTPWNIQERTGDEDVIPVFRRYANLRMNLLPYILSEAHYSSQSGVPMMRALALEYPEDLRCREYPFQYLFGRSLLVAPVVEPGIAVWDVYLPDGRWFDFWTGELYTGPQLLSYKAAKDTIPVFVRGGCILPLNLDESRTLPSPVGNAVDRYDQLCFKIYGADEAAYNWYDSLSGQHYPLHAQYDLAGRKWLLDSGNSGYTSIV